MATTSNPTILLGYAAKTITDYATLITNIVISDVPAGENYILQLINNGRVVFTRSTSAADRMLNQIYDYPVLSANLGVNNFKAVATSLQRFTIASNEVTVVKLPDAINGTSTTAMTSIDIAGLRTDGFAFTFLTTTSEVVLADGTIGVGVNSTEAVLQRLYLGLLGRSGDAAGLSVYDAQMSKGATAAQVAAQMLVGPEYASQGTLTDAQFVTSLYSGFLNRAPQTAEVMAPLAQLAQGTSRAVLAASFATSSESMQAFASSTASVFARDADGTLVNQVYRTGLNRQIDAGGLATYKTFLGTGAAASGLVAAIAGSGEFAALHAGQSNAAFIGDLYRGGLSREADGAGLANYVHQLENGAVDRATVTLAIATSGEAMIKLPGTL